MVLLENKSEIITSYQQKADLPQRTFDANNSITINPIFMEIGWLDSADSELSEKSKFIGIGSVDAELFKKL